jgi:hypothetical protein
MNDGIVPQADDLVLHQQLAALQFRDLKIIGGRMHERVVDFFFQRPVPPFKLRKMRLNAHGGLSPSSDWLPDLVILHQIRPEFDARFGCATQQSPECGY